MLFNSLQFLIFFPIVIICYFVLPQKIRYLWLLAVSYYFYMCWNASYVVLLLFSTVVTYLGGLTIEWCKHRQWTKEKERKVQKWCMAIGLLLNIGVLCYFKYANFFMDTLQNIFSIFSIELHIPKFDILLPIGISFFTFQSLSYLFDVYRNDIYAEKNFFRYALFVSFFPQLVAGPIERSKNLLKQLAIPTKFDVDNAKEGILLMLWGYFLKVVLADRIAIYVDCVYGDYETYAGVYLIIATLLFAFQLYCDFYGYSVIAMGSAKILGYQLTDNFQAPFLSQSIAELWRRWHISLNTWFRDYLYIPLGGNRKGKLIQYRNKLIVFFVSGLWHGANWTFVVWGMMNGLYQMIGEALKPVRDRLVHLLRLNRDSWSHKGMQVLITFLLFDFTAVFFRTPGIKDAVNIIQSMITCHNPWIVATGEIYECGLDQKNFAVMLISILILLIADACKYRGIQIRKVIMKQEWWFQYSLLAGTILVILLLGIWGGAYDGNNFIYFQF